MFFCVKLDQDVRFTLCPCCHAVPSCSTNTGPIVFISVSDGGARERVCADCSTIPAWDPQGSLRKRELVGVEIRFPALPRYWIYVHGRAGNSCPMVKSDGNANRVVTLHPHAQRSDWRTDGYQFCRKRNSRVKRAAWWA
jgi:hypothetical protein